MHRFRIPRTDERFQKLTQEELVLDVLSLNILDRQPEEIRRFLKSDDVQIIDSTQIEKTLSEEEKKLQGKSLDEIFDKSEMDSLKELDELLDNM